jgi:hypothetical protein
MHTYFHSWRRKAGVITLVMACVFMGAWIRSLRVQDQLVVPRRDSAHLFASRNGILGWVRVSPLLATIEWSSIAVTGTMEDSWGDAEAHWRWHYCGIDIGAATLTAKSQGRVIKMQFEQWGVPYWTIVMPPTLLSAYLILWKPRKRSDKPA